MIAADRTQSAVRGLVDAKGRLREADDLLAELNAAAGGDIGEPVALPAIAGLARLALRLRVLISRKVIVADGDRDLELWVRAEPSEAGVRLALTGWRPRPSTPPLLEDVSAEPIAADGAAWRWETDSGLRLTRLSPAAGSAHEFHPAAVLGQPLTGLFALAEEADGTLPLLVALAANAPFEAQQATVRPSGKAVHLSGTPRYDRLGQFAGFSGLAHPIDTEEQPEPPMADLFAERLGAALRGPLGRIIANADSITAQPDGPVSESYADYAADIAAAGRHLLGLVGDLADLEAVERPDFTVEREPIDLADLARRAAGLLAVRASAAEVMIEQPADDAALPATGEFRRVLQILVNLIGNAVRYAPRGSAVRVTVTTTEGVAAVTVADRGKGVATEDQERIFDKFARVDPREPGGSGLGLYIARRLARAMGGDVTVESTPGEGARFTLLLPVGG
jgi:signal transduction histidine kinase